MKACRTCVWKEGEGGGSAKLTRNLTLVVDYPLLFLSHQTLYPSIGLVSSFELNFQTGLE